MTKPKRPRPPKPVLAWCVVTANGHICIDTVCPKLSIARQMCWHGDQVVRVEIRPAPKRRKGAK